MISFLNLLFIFNVCEINVVNVRILESECRIDLNVIVSWKTGFDQMRSQSKRKFKSSDNRKSSWKDVYFFHSFLLKQLYTILNNRFILFFYVIDLFLWHSFLWFLEVPHSYYIFFLFILIHHKDWALRTFASHFRICVVKAFIIGNIYGFVI